MNNLFKTILIISIAIFGAGVLFISPTQAQPPPANLEVNFQETPLFDKTNFLPGDDVIRWVKVTNNSGENQEIGVNVTGYSECLGDYCLSDELNLVISKDGNSLYTGSLTDFYKAGEIYLSNLPNGNTNQYDFSITFIPETEDNYQGLGTSFNFEIGFWGESISGEISPVGGGGVFIAGLEIINEMVSDVATNSVTIIWDTNKKSTSRVIYSPSDQSYVFDWTKPPNYGYLYSTPEYDTSPRVTAHSVTITGLTAGTKYYYRAVSHASLAISLEYSFTTLGVKIEELIPPGEEIVPPEEEIPTEEVVLAPPGEEEIVPPEEVIPPEEEVVVPPEELVITPPEERVPGEGWASLLLASLGEIGETSWMAIIVVFCIIGLVIIGIREWELARKKKKQI